LNVAAALSKSDSGMQRGSSAGYEASSMGQMFNKKPSLVANYLALLLDATVATMGFPDIGLQGFKNTNDEGRK
jgi:hypothetical protein